LNPGPEGERAVGYLDDDEDSGGHSLQDTITTAKNRMEAIEGTLQYFDQQKNKQYSVQPGQIPFLIHRDRGWTLDEQGKKKKK
jgi:malate synthase